MRLSDQEREARRRATAAMTRCPCGNVARFGETQCGRCAEESLIAEIEAEDNRRIIDEIFALDPRSEDFADDLRNVLHTLLARTLP